MTAWKRLRGQRRAAFTQADLALLEARVRDGPEPEPALAEPTPRPRRTRPARRSSRAPDSPPGDRFVELRAAGAGWDALEYPPGFQAWGHRHSALPTGRSATFCGALFVAGLNARIDAHRVHVRVR